MKVKSLPFVDLIALNSSGRVIHIDNHIQRKPMSVDDQKRHLGKNSILITCNYVFKEKKFDWSPNVVAVCHPFRELCTFPDRIQKHLFSESDFCDQINTHTSKRKSTSKQYDFVYFTINSMQGIYCKGLYLLRAIDIAAHKSGLKGLIVNYGPPNPKNKGQPDPLAESVLNKCRKYMSSLKATTMLNNLLKPKEISDITNNAKFVLFPNTRDASPRMIPETLVNNTPILLNKNIYGGWKYIDEQNGRMFDAPSLNDYWEKQDNSIEEGFIESLSKHMTEMINTNFVNIADNYYKKYGFLNSARRMADVFNNIQGSDYKMVGYAEWEQDMINRRDLV